MNKQFIPIAPQVPISERKKTLALAKRFYFPFKLSSEEKFFKLSGFRWVPAHVMQRLVWSILLKWSRSASTSPTPLGVPTPQSRGFPVNKKQMLEWIFVQPRYLWIEWISQFLKPYISSLNSYCFFTDLIWSVYLYNNCQGMSTLSKIQNIPKQSKHHNISHIWMVYSLHFHSHNWNCMLQESGCSAFAIAVH